MIDLSQINYWPFVYVEIIIAAILFVLLFRALNKRHK